MAETPRSTGAVQPSGEIKTPATPLKPTSEGKKAVIQNLTPEKGGLTEKGFLASGKETPVGITRDQDRKLYNYLDSYVKNLKSLRDSNKLSQHDLDLLKGYELLYDKLAGRKGEIDKTGKESGLFSGVNEMRIFQNENEMTLGLLAMEEIRRYEAASLAIEIINNPGFKPEAYKAPSGKAFAIPPRGGQLLHIPTAELQYGGLRGVFAAIGATLRYEPMGFVDIEFHDLGAANKILTDYITQSGFAGSRTRGESQKDLNEIESFRQDIFSRLTRKNRTTPEFRAMMQDFDETYDVKSATGGKNNLVIHNLIASQLDELMKRPENAGGNFMTISREQRFKLRTEAARSAANKLLKQERDLIEKEFVEGKRVVRAGEENVGMNTMEQVAKDLEGGKYLAAATKPTKADVETAQKAEEDAKSVLDITKERVERVLGKEGKTSIITDLADKKKLRDALEGRKNAAGYTAAIGTLDIQIKDLNDSTKAGSPAKAIVDAQAKIDSIQSEIDDIKSTGEYGSGPGRTPVAVKDRDKAIEDRRSQMEKMEGDIAKIIENQRQSLTTYQTELTRLRTASDTLEEKFQDADADYNKIKNEYTGLLTFLGISTSAGTDVETEAQKGLTIAQRELDDKKKDHDKKKNAFEGTPKLTKAEEEQVKLEATAVRAIKENVEKGNYNKTMASVAFDEAELKKCANIDTGTEEIRDLFFRWIKGDEKFANLFRAGSDYSRQMLSDTEIVLSLAEYYGRLDTPSIKPIYDTFNIYRQAESDLRQFLRNEGNLTPTIFLFRKAVLETAVKTAAANYSAEKTSRLRNATNDILPELTRHDSLEAVGAFDQLYEGLIAKCLSGKPFEERVFEHQERTATIT